ncbi:MAG: MipA/OmpV family protein [Candidatus Manganitrophaceae bacterium]
MQAIVRHCVVALALGLAQMTEVGAEPQEKNHNPRTADQSHIELTFGAAYTNQPLSGGARTRSRATPLIDAELRVGRFFASTTRGIGYNVVNRDTLTVGIAAGYLWGRKESDDTRYRGLENIAGSPAVIASIIWSPIGEAILLYAAITQTIGHEQGRFAMIGTILGFPIAGSLSGFIDLSGTWSDKQYARRFYGVGPTESARSGYPVYQPTSGWSGTSGIFGVSYELTPTWSIGAGLGATRLEGTAAQSPIFNKSTLPYASLFATYAN